MGPCRVQGRLHKLSPPSTNGWRRRESSEAEGSIPLRCDALWAEKRTLFVNATRQVSQVHEVADVSCYNAA